MTNRDFVGDGSRWGSPSVVDEATCLDRGPSPRSDEDVLADHFFVLYGTRGFVDLGLVRAAVSWDSAPR